ncbi:hypothetical protein ACIBCU_38235 [Streptomyces sp. NPDC051064]|uniref:hypothetical protein n=1 Tax=Streptomyces sp. NPDC051064 TaxID=3365641 RepID=UPI0037A2746F
MPSTTWQPTYFISETKRSRFPDLAADLPLDRRALLDAPVSAPAEVEEDVPEHGALAAVERYMTVATSMSNLGSSFLRCFCTMPGSPFVRRPNLSSDGWIN